MSFPPKDLQEIRHSTLSAYYPHLVTLFTYLEFKLRSEDRGILHASDCQILKDVLDSGVVGLSDEMALKADEGGKWKVEDVVATQQEALDQTLVLIFKQRSSGGLATSGSPINVLAAGYKLSGYDQAPNMSRSGIDSSYVNSQVTLIRTAPEWQALHARLGSSLFITLLSQTTIFLPLPNRCYTQLCGRPMYCVPSLKSLEDAARKRKRQEKKRGERRYEGDDVRRKRRRIEKQAQKDHLQGRSTSTSLKKIERADRGYVNSPVEVKILRNRMFYGRWGYTGGKRVPCCGLPPGHILNNNKPLPPRSTVPDPALVASGLMQPKPPGYDHHQCARTLLRYIFPRQHGLQNVYTTPPPAPEKSFGRPLVKDWADRRDEIEAAVREKKAKTPGRLKGCAMQVATEITARHDKCDYWKLRAVHCPSKCRKSKELGLEQGSVDFTKFACPQSQVSRYAIAVCRAILPGSVWGSDRNARLIYKHVEAFVKARRFESFSVHQILQGFSVNECTWLHTGRLEERVPMAEQIKRHELVEELVFWLFDGLLVPLLKHTFFITETAFTKYRTTYFRQDDWETLTRPALNQLTNTTFRKLSPGRQSVLRRAPEAYSVIRLLPKANGVRPIANLGKKLRKVSAAGAIAYGKSINDILTGPFQVLSVEKDRHQDLLASSLFGLYDIYGRLKAFRNKIMRSDGKLPKLYFVKVDVKAAFDSIDQNKLMEVVSEVLNYPTDYTTAKFVQLLPASSRAPRLWKKRAFRNGEMQSFHKMASSLAEGLQNAVFVDQVECSSESRSNVFQTLNKHVKQNLIKIGRDWYSQSQGIPQGSKVSSLLCSYFYGHLEKMRLAFVNDPESMLLRIIDDFLFITADRTKAERFYQRMYTGHSEYGCEIAKDKTLVNFRLDELEMRPQECEPGGFPYCGMLIDTETLALKIDTRRNQGLHVRESLTVKSTTKQGQAFLGWLKRMLENHNHILYNDTLLNSRAAVCSNIYTNFLFAGMKTVHYLKHLGTDLAIHGPWVYDAVNNAISHTCNANRAHLKSLVGLEHDAQCTIGRSTFIWLAKHAFHTSVARKASHVKVLSQALEADLAKREFARLRRDPELARVVEECRQRIAGCGF